MAFENIGSTKLSMQDLAGARAALKRALELNPRSARAEVGLGAVEMAAGNRDAAFGHWRRAVELDSSDLEALYNLATGLAAAGRRDEARPYAEAFVRQAPPARFAREMAETPARQITGDSPCPSVVRAPWQSASWSSRGSSAGASALALAAASAGPSRLNRSSDPEPKSSGSTSACWTHRGTRFATCAPTRSKSSRKARHRPILLFQHIEEPSGPYEDVARRTIAGEVSTNQGAPRGHLYVLIFDQQHIETGQRAARADRRRAVPPHARPPRRPRRALRAARGRARRSTSPRNVERAASELIKVRGSLERV